MSHWHWNSFGRFKYWLKTSSCRNVLFENRHEFRTQYRQDAYQKM